MFNVGAGLNIAHICVRHIRQGFSEDITKTGVLEPSVDVSTSHMADRLIHSTIIHLVKTFCREAFIHYKHLLLLLLLLLLLSLFEESL